MIKHHPDCPHSVLSDSIIIRNSMYPCKYCDIAESAEKRGYERGYERAKSDLRHMVPDAYNDGFLKGFGYNQHGQGENP